MSPRQTYLAGSAIAFSLLVGVATLQADDPVIDDSATASSAAAAMHFTDDKGNPRASSAAERAELAAALQADLARLTRGKPIPQGSRTLPDGSVSAVVGTQNIQFLTVTLDEEGNATFGHSSMDEQGQIEPPAASDLPEM